MATAGRLRDVGRAHRPAPGPAGNPNRAEAVAGHRPTPGRHQRLRHGRHSDRLVVEEYLPAKPRGPPTGRRPSTCWSSGGTRPRAADPAGRQCAGGRVQAHDGACSRCAPALPSRLRAGPSVDGVGALGRTGFGLRAAGLGQARVSGSICLGGRRAAARCPRVTARAGRVLANRAARLAALPWPAERIAAEPLSTPTAGCSPARRPPSGVRSSAAIRSAGHGRWRASRSARSGPTGTGSPASTVSPRSTVPGSSGPRRSAWRRPAPRADPVAPSTATRYDRWTRPTEAEKHGRADVDRGVRLDQPPHVGDPPGQQLGVCAERTAGARRRPVGGPGGRGGQVLLDDDVGVRAAHAEGADAGPAGPVARHGCGAVGMASRPGGRAMCAPSVAKPASGGISP